VHNFDQRVSIYPIMPKSGTTTLVEWLVGSLTTPSVDVFLDLAHVGFPALCVSVCVALVALYKKHLAAYWREAWEVLEEGRMMEEKAARMSVKQRKSRVVEVDKENKKKGDELPLVSTGKLLGEFRSTEWKFVLPNTVIGLLLTMLQLFTPQLTGNLYDEMMPGSTNKAATSPIMERLPGYVATMTSVALVIWLLKQARGVLMRRARFKYLIKTRGKLLRNIFAQDMSFFDCNDDGDLTHQVWQMSNQMQDMVNQYPTKIADAATAVLLGFAWVASNADWKLAAIGVVRGVCVIVVQVFQLRYYRYIHRVQQKNMKKSRLLCKEALENIPTVVVHAAEELEMKYVCSEV
jgi:ABC-type bacteriocin/lantibiotic exporter with double-glycine peptidase domain